MLQVATHIFSCLIYPTRHFVLNTCKYVHMSEQQINKTKNIHIYIQTMDMSRKDLKDRMGKEGGW